MRLHTADEIKLYLNLFGERDTDELAPIFISQPMSGIPEKEVLFKREMVMHNVKKLHDRCYILDSYFKDQDELDKIPEEYRAVWCLGDSIKIMSQAGLVIFTKGWMYARGCMIEHRICAEYNIPYCCEDDLIREKKED